MPTNEERLKTYGFSLSDVSLQDLVVPAGQTFLLKKGASVGQFTELKTKSFTTLKKWIGFSDDLVRANPHLMKRAAVKAAVPVNLIPMTRTAAEPGAVSLPAKFTRGLKKDTKVIANKFLYGDSARVANASSILERAFGKIDLGIVLLKVIEVKAGAVLEIAKDVQILWAYKLKIHEGGKVKVHLGNTFKLDVDILEKA